MDKSSTLAAYIRKVLDIQDDQVTEAHLRELAYELGLSESDYAELQEIYDDHLTRGTGFLGLRNWDDAIEEFRQANALNPLKTEGLLLQAQAYEGKWLETGKPQYEAEALFHARKVLAVDPDHEAALILVSRMRKSEQSTSKPQQLFAVLGILLILGIGFGILLKQDSAPPVPPKKDQSAELAPLSDSRIRPTNPEFELFSRFDIPVKIFYDRAEDLEFIPETSEIHDLNSRHTYLLQGWVRIKRGEIRKLKMDVELVLANGKKWMETVYRVHDRPSPGARTGDVLPFGLSMVKRTEVPDSILEVRISVNEITLDAAPDRYRPSLPIELSWAHPRPTQVQLEVKARVFDVVSNPNYPYLHVAWEIKNTGTVPLDPIVLRQDWYDASNHLIMTKNLYVVGANVLPLKPGRTYIIGGTYSLKDMNPDELSMPMLTIEKVGQKSEGN